MPLLIVRDDITKMKVDAIVNPANREVRQGRGTSRAIFVAAGETKLTEACQEAGGCETRFRFFLPDFTAVRRLMHFILQRRQSMNSYWKRI